MSVILQDILTGLDNNYPCTLTALRVAPDEAARRLFLAIKEDTTIVGIAYHLSSKGHVDFICLATADSSDVFVVSFAQKPKTNPKTEFAKLLCAGAESSQPTPAHKVGLVGFSMAKIAVQVSRAAGLRVKGVDLSTLFKTPWEPYLPSNFIADKICKSVKKRAIDRLWMGNKASAERDVVLQAWLAAYAGRHYKARVSETVRLDTQHVTSHELDCLSQLVAQAELLERMKPREVQNDFSKAGYDKKGDFQIQNSRYKTRIRANNQIIMSDEKGNKIRGAARKVKGRTATIALLDKKPLSATVKHVNIVGPTEPTNPERARDELIFLVMAGCKSLRGSSFIRAVWFSGQKQTLRSPTTVDFQQADTVISAMKLNKSQRSAVHAMIGDSPFTIVHGPPGTGKTTTIATAAKIWELHGPSLCVWIVAHSNVAVKNIAEKLCKTGVNFKLLVSMEFYEEWHDHLYGEIEDKLILSDDFPKQKVGMERLLLDTRIILSTLGMMSNMKLRSNGTFELVPPKCLVIDEASQISAFEYMPVFHSFHEVLDKVCFFGDPKQLPPFGKDDVPTMKTIFDFKHLNNKKSNGHFLDTQYRMPNAIGSFISLRVYDGRLQSNHSITSSDCLAFIDVSRTGEESAGSSSRNAGEVDTVIHLVKYYYGKLDFCVITPYDAQRAAIQKGLQNENLRWDTVYNVDSFQGNEADYVIVSLVRSSRAGFLRSLERMNVLLTRCRKGLVIVSNQAFLGPNGKGSETLVGKLLEFWKAQSPSHSWIDWRFVADASVNLPGFAAPKPRPSDSRINLNPPAMRSAGTTSIVQGSRQQTSPEAARAKVVHTSKQQNQQLSKTATVPCHKHRKNGHLKASLANPQQQEGAKASKGTSKTSSTGTTRIRQ